MYFEVRLAMKDLQKMNLIVPRRFSLGGFTILAE